MVGELERLRRQVEDALGWRTYRLMNRTGLRNIDGTGVRR
jgi:hypothetical protein